MKILFLSPSAYTYHSMFEFGFSQLNHSFHHFNYQDSMSKWQNKFNVQARRLPHSLRSKWNHHYLQKINNQHIEVFNKQKPNIVIIYNNEMLLPSTLDHFKKNGAKIVFYLGDNPYYTHTNDYNLTLLFQSDLVIVPDTYWQSQLQLLGIKNIYFDMMYHNPGLSDKLETGEQNSASDLLFIGECYSNSWGYKRVLFVSKFADLDIKVHGTTKWQRWLEFFPELKPKFILKKGRYSEDYVTKLHLNAKIYPVDANPGLLNGVHLRVLDCIGYGLLPLPEYRKDIETVFGSIGLPIIEDYNEGPSIAQYYLDHEKQRSELINDLRNFVRENYTPEMMVSRLLKKL